MSENGKDVVPVPAPPAEDPRKPGPPPQFNSVRAYMRSGGTIKVVYIRVEVNLLDGYNHYYGVDNLALCSIKREDVSAWVNLDIPMEEKQGESGPVRTFPAGVTVTSGYPVG